MSVTRTFGIALGFCALMASSGAGAQEVGQVADDPVLKIAALHDQKAGRVARVGGAQGDARLGQVEVEIGCPHGAGNAHAPPLRSSETRRKVDWRKPLQPLCQTQPMGV